jgi:hypothetical protein
VTGSAVRVFRWLSWVPAATLAGTWLYVERYDGWGAWAAAPLLLLPIGLSAVMAAVGLAFCLKALKSHGIDHLTTLATLLAALPVIWFAIRVLLTS